MALTDRKGGMVARVRVNPKDCLGVLDCMQVMGMEARDHSFSGCVSLVLSSLIAFARQQGIITQDEDGFQYLNRMQYFLDQTSTQAKRERTNAAYESAVRGDQPPILSKPVIESRPFQTPENKEAELKEYRELLAQYNSGNESLLPRIIAMQQRLF